MKSPFPAKQKSLVEMIKQKFLRSCLNVWQSHQRCRVKMALDSLPGWSMRCLSWMPTLGQNPASSSAWWGFTSHVWYWAELYNQQNDRIQLLAGYTTSVSRGRNHLQMDFQLKTKPSLNTEIHYAKVKGSCLTIFLTDYFSTSKKYCIFITSGMIQMFNVLLAIWILQPIMSWVDGLV